MTMLKISWFCAPVIRDEIYEQHEVDDHNHMLKTIKSTYVNARVEALESKHWVILLFLIYSHIIIFNPLLFLIYVNDVPCASSFQTTLFPDDTSLHISHKDIKTLQRIVQNELDKVDTWMRSNRLSINYNKTTYMILTATPSQNCNFEISMNDVRIQKTDSIKYLGVIIDNKLSWKPQIRSLCGKFSQACGVACKIRHFSDMKILRLIYFSLFHSHLQYCIIDWVRAYKTVIRPVQVLQNRILKYITFSKRTSSANNIFKLLRILKVSDLY